MTTSVDTDMQRFLRYADVRGRDDCWLWSGSFSKRNGYPRFWLNGSTIGAHRASYILHSGQIPDGMLICHTCDTPACVNPSHLFLGTHQDNMDDMWRKERGVRNGHGPSGEKCARSKLTEDIVLRIRQMYEEGASQAKIAAKFSVTQGNVYHIVHRLTWKHI